MLKSKVGFNPKGNFQEVEKKEERKYYAIQKK
jgi:hypothetical protein